MTTVGSYEAKTHLPKLLKRVARGEQILITKRGMPIAMLCPPTQQPSRNVKKVVQQIKALRQGNILGDDLSIRELIEEGRRF